MTLTEDILLSQHPIAQTKAAPGLLEVTWTGPSVLSAATPVCTSGSNVHGELTKSEEPIKLMW